MKQSQLFISESFNIVPNEAEEYYLELCHQLELSMLVVFGRRSRIAVPKNSVPVINCYDTFPGDFQEIDSLIFEESTLMELIFSMIKIARRVLEQVKLFSPQLIHVSSRPYSGIAALTIKKWLGIPYIIYLTRSEILKFQTNPLLATIMTWTFQKADAIIVDYENTKTKLCSYNISPQKIHIINPGIDDSFFSPNISNPDIVEKNQLDNKIVVLSVGFKATRNLHQQFIKAVKILSNDFPDICGLVLCNKVEVEDLKQLVSYLDISRNFIFVVDPTPEELISLYHSCDTVIIAGNDHSAQERKHPLAAGAASKCVIGGISGNPVEMIQDNMTGFIVDLENPIEISEKLHLLITNDSLRLKMGQKGRLWAENFQWSKQIDKINAVTNKILSSSMMASEKQGQYHSTGN